MFDEDFYLFLSITKVIWIRNLSCKKKQDYIKSDEPDKTISIKIEVMTNHLINSDIVESIENQLFNFDVDINEYEVMEDKKAMEDALKQAKKEIDKQIKQEQKEAKELLKAEKQREKEYLKSQIQPKAKKISIKYKGKVINK
jgi:hypothetical protein